MVARGSQGASGCPSRGAPPCHSSPPEEWASQSPGALAKVRVAGLQPQSLTQIWVALKMFILTSSHVELLWLGWSEVHVLDYVCLSVLLDEPQTKGFFLSADIFYCSGV